MTEFEPTTLQQQIGQQSRRVQGLQLTVYSQPDPSADMQLHQQLAEEEAKLAELRNQLAAAAPTVTSEDRSKAVSGSRGRYLGKETTGLSVRIARRMDPLPTGAYHLMNPETDPLLTVEVENASRDIRRVCVKAYIEELTAHAVRTVEIEPRQTESVNLQPTLLPERAKSITEVQRATMHVIAEDLDGRPESHDTYTITCLARNSSFNGVRWTDTGELVDLSRYYGAWVTPYAEAVQERIRRAVELAPDRRLIGYQGDPTGIDGQVAALYQSLREAEIAYVNSVIDYGSPAGISTQRTRLPRESLLTRSANCIDGTVLMASLMEGISLNPAIVLVPGHAFVGWEKWYGSGEWSFLETTMIGSHDFEAACQSGQRQHARSAEFNRDQMKLYALQDLRDNGIWPME